MAVIDTLQRPWSSRSPTCQRALWGSTRQRQRAIWALQRESSSTNQGLFVYPISAKRSSKLRSSRQQLWWIRWPATSHTNHRGYSVPPRYSRSSRCTGCRKPSRLWRAICTVLRGPGPLFGLWWIPSLLCHVSTVLSTGPVNCPWRAPPGPSKRTTSTSASTERAPAQWVSTVCQW